MPKVGAGTSYGKDPDGLFADASPGARSLSRREFAQTIGASFTEAKQTLNQRIACS
jgi:hypothetical protein